MEDAFLTHEATRKRRRWGCACGCALFLCGLTLGAISFAIYLLKPLPFLPRERFLTPETIAFGNVELDMSDEGISAVVGRNLRAIAEWQAKAEGGDPAKAANVSYDVLRQGVSQFIHQDMFLIRNDGQHPTVAVLQLRNAFSHLLVRVILQSVAEKAGGSSGPSLKVERGDGFELFSAPKGGAVALTNNSVIAGATADSVREVAKAALREGAGTLPAALEDYLTNLDTSPPPPGEDLTFVVSNKSDALQRVLDGVGAIFGTTGTGEEFQAGLERSKVNPADITGARLGANIESVDKARLEISVDCTSADVAAKLATALGAVLERTLTPPAGRSGPTGKVTSRQSTSRALITIEVTGLEPYLTDLLRLKTAPASGQQP